MKLLALIIAPIISGISYAVSFPTPFSEYFFPGTFISMVLFAWSLLAQKNSFKREIAVLLFFSLGLNLTGYYWIRVTMESFGNLPTSISTILWVLHSIIIAPQYLVFLIILYLSSSTPRLSFIRDKCLYLAIILTLCEYYTPQLFPGHVGHVWMAFAPNLGMAPIVGGPFFSFVLFWPAFSLARFLHMKKNFEYLSIITFIIFFAANFLFPLNTDMSAAKPFNIRMVQGNIGSYMKVDAETGNLITQEKIYKTYYDLTLQRPDKSLDLIIWPETAYSEVLNSQKVREKVESIPKQLTDITRETGAAILTGGYDLNNAIPVKETFESQYNTAFFINRKSEFKQLYHKIKLLPFGETLPLGPLNKFLSKYIDNISYFAAGDTFPLFKTEEDISFITTICYELLYSRFISNYLNNVNGNAHFIVNLTNDSWFGVTAEPRQHLFLSKWRALEFNIPILRSTNTGITVVIYPNGLESRRLNWYQEDFLDVTLHLEKRQATIFQKWGILSSVVIWMLLVLIAFIKSTHKFHFFR